MGAEGMLWRVLASGSVKTVLVAGKHRAQWAPCAWVLAGRCASWLAVGAEACCAPWQGGRAVAAAVGACASGTAMASGMAQALPAAMRSSKAAKSMERNKEAMGLW